MKLLMLLIAMSFATKRSNIVAETDGNCGVNVNGGDKATVLVKIEEDEYAKNKGSSSQYIGVSYNARCSKWKANRYSKHEKKSVHNGYHADEETAALASDTLGRKLMANGEQGHKLNFPYDDSEVSPEEKSQYIGVSYHIIYKKWQANRYSKLEKKILYNGTYKDKETAAHASDTLARQLMANGEKSHKINFPDDDIEVFPEKKLNSSQFTGVSYDFTSQNWRSRRYSKHEKIIICNGRYDNEEAAAHASDKLARELKANGEQGHNLNFLNDRTEAFPEERHGKRKRPNHEDLNHPKDN